LDYVSIFFCVCGLFPSRYLFIVTLMALEELTKACDQSVMFYSFFFFLAGLEFELKTWLLQNSCSAASATPPVHFALVILEMGSCELFPQAGLKL
jgi:hypothetical protein